MKSSQGPSTRWLDGLTAIADCPALFSKYDAETIEELERRRSNLMNNPASALSWEQAKRMVRGADGV